MSAPYELGRVAYEEFIRGADDRLPWHQLNAHTQAHWARVELASRKAEERSIADLRELAESGRTSPTKLWGKR